MGLVGQKIGEGQADFWLVLKQIGYGQVDMELT